MEEEEEEEVVVVVVVEEEEEEEEEVVVVVVVVVVPGVSICVCQVEWQSWRLSGIAQHCWAAGQLEQAE